MPQLEPGAGTKYDAFISYSHAADDALAPALQRALHRLACPWWRMRALRVFRDQTSLSASPELWAAIEAALTQSRHLLLMASPAAAASRWVGREIAWWLANRSPGTLLIIVTDGELAWDGAQRDFDWSRTDCLPREILAGALPDEPLWVDLRWARSGELLDLHHARFRQAVLDLAAPLHGRDKDELDGEDVRAFARARRLRRGAIAGLAGLTLAALAAGWLATVQRNRAERQTRLVQLGRLSVQADLLRARGEPADASVMLAAEALQGLTAMGAPPFDADRALRGALAGLPVVLHEFDFPSSRYRIAPGGHLLIKRDPTVDALAAYSLPDGRFASCDAARMGAPPGSAPLIVALSANGRWCMAEPRSGTGFELWRAQPLERVQSWPPSEAGVRLIWNVGDDGDALALTRRQRAGGDPATSSMEVWRRSRPDRLRRDGAEFIAFAPDGRSFAATDGLWPMPDDTVGEGQPVWRWNRPPAGVAFSPDGAFVAMRSETAGPVEIWSMAEASVRYTLDRVPPGELAALGDGAAVLAVLGRRETWLWDMPTDRMRVRLPMAAAAAAIDGRDLLALVGLGAGDGTTRQRLVRLPFLGAAWAGTALPPDLDAQTLQSIAVDGATVRLGVRGDARVDTLAWSPGQTGWTLEKGVEQGAVSVDAPQTRSRRADSAGSASAPVAAPGAASAAYGAAVGEAQVVVSRGSEEVAQVDVPTGVDRTAADPAGRALAVLDNAGIVSLHRLAPADLIAQACARAPRPLPPVLRALVPDAPAQDACGRPHAASAPVR